MNVPCNGCTACCKHDRVFLGPKDDPFAFKWHEDNGYAVLDTKDNGECVYLADDGCSIHGHAPAICKRMDCRELFKATTPEFRSIRIIENPQMKLVYEAGMERLQ